MKLLPLVVVGLTLGTAAAVAQQPQAVMPPAATSQEPQPAMQPATEQMLLEEATAHRNWLAKAMSLEAWNQGLTKQVGELRAKVTDGEKKLAEANAEINELKGLGTAPKPAAGSKGPKPGDFINENGTIKQVPPKQ